MPKKSKALLDAYGTMVNRLSFRLFALLALALFPLGVIAVYQTDQVLDETENLRRNALFFETTSAARDERELIQQTLGSAEGLAALSILDDAPACREVMREFAESNAHIAFAGYTKLSGIMECGSEGEEVGDFRTLERLQRALDADGPSVYVAPLGSISQQPVLVVNHPVYVDRSLTGIVSLSVPLRLTYQPLTSPRYDHELRFVTFTNDGQTISASGGRDNAEDILPQMIDPKDLTRHVGTTFTGEDGLGEERIYAVASIFQDQVSVIASWPARTSVWGGALAFYVLNLLFPFAIWAAGLAFAWYELRRVVIRHVRDLRSAMRRFALGQRDGFPLRLENPPEEFAEAERAFNRMAIIIAESEARQDKDLKDKEVLLKEVHHRVKNNLQMIASIMNMQLRSAKTPEAKFMLASLQRRVNGLAMLHRTLYTTPDLLTIEANELLEAVVTDISTMMTVPGIKIERELDALPLYPDQAVPLSMLLAEALTNALKYVGAKKDETPSVRVTLKEQSGGQYQLSVINSKGPIMLRPIPEVETISGLGTKLMKAFVSQLDGHQEVTEDDDHYGLHVTFERKDFESAT
ncbi:sensor histidine kinase [Roseovarius sp.]|uniref:sensor histidine kinase n=1 Tax=Roseovarius sp. TaxID=1486281 RepID=UPI003B5B30B5